MDVRRHVIDVASGWLRLPVARQLPQGLYLARDIRRLLPNLVVKHVFDVGANEGQTAVQYAKSWPSARIDCFEPIDATYQRLVRRVSGNQSIHCHRLALGDTHGPVAMSMDEGASDRFRIDLNGTELVDATTVSRFAAAKGIESINVLKVDAEGYDLIVLRGAEALINAQSIDLIQVEAGMYPENELHVYFEEFTNYLHARDYRILGLYEQMHEWKHGYPNLRRANIVFASRCVLDANH